MSAVSNMQSQSDLGPEIQHFYEVSNFGPFDVGHVIVSDLQILRKLKLLDLISFQVNISWPLQTIEGDWLLYLTDTPVIKV